MNARDGKGLTALHHAAGRGDNEMILYLVSKGADVTAVGKRSERRSPIMRMGRGSAFNPLPTPSRYWRCSGPGTPTSAFRVSRGGATFL